MCFDNRNIDNFFSLRFNAQTLSLSQLISFMPAEFSISRSYCMTFYFSLWQGTFSPSPKCWTFFDCHYYRECNLCWWNNIINTYTGLWCVAVCLYAVILNKFHFCYCWLVLRQYYTFLEQWMDFKVQKEKEGGFSVKAFNWWFNWWLTYSCCFPPPHPCRLIKYSLIRGRPIYLLWIEYRGSSLKKIDKLWLLCFFPAVSFTTFP